MAPVHRTVGNWGMAAAMEVVVDRYSVASLSTQQCLFRYVGVDSLFQIEGVTVCIILSLWF